MSVKAEPLYILLAVISKVSGFTRMTSTMMCWCVMASEDDARADFMKMFERDKPGLSSDELIIRELPESLM